MIQLTILVNVSTPRNRKEKSVMKKIELCIEYTTPIDINEIYLRGSVVYATSFSGYVSNEYFYGYQTSLDGGKLEFIRVKLSDCYSVGDSMAFLCIPNPQANFRNWKTVTLITCDEFNKGIAN